MTSEQRVTALAAGALLVSSLSLGGCSSSTVGSLMDAQADAPAKTSAYLPVEDMPRERDARAITPDEQSKLKQEPIAARESQAAAAKAQEGLAPAEPVKP
jgi:hypothetical protein